MNKKSHFVALILLPYFLFVSPISAQNSVLDSILSLPATRGNIDFLLQQTIYKKELKDYTKKALELSEQLEYTDGIMHALDQLGVMERNNSNYKEALDYHNKCLTLAEAEHSDYWLLRSYLNLGVVYRRIDAYEKALKHFLTAYPIAEKLKNEKEVASCLGNIGSLYLVLDKLDEAMEYFLKSLDIASKQNNYQGLAITHGSIGRVYENKNKLDSALYYYERNLYYSTGWNDNNGIAISNNSMGNVAKKKGDWKKALEYYKNALEINLKINDRNYLAPNYANLGEVYLNLNDWEKAEQNYLQSLKIAEEAGIKRSMAEAWRGLSNTFEKQKRYSEALQASRRQMALEDSVLNDENLHRIELLKISFEVQQKEQTIATLQAIHEIDALKNRQKHIALLISAGLVVGLILFIIMYIRSIRQERMITKQRLRQFEQEKQLIATQSLLDGETKERARIARDLHDGLGSILTGAKLSLLEMKKDVTLGYKEVERFDKALDLLDRSVNEMRRVAHHLMPDSLSRFGLKPALNDFCNNLLSVTFSYYGDESRLDPKLEVMIYRCLHELINNALKHAEASKIIVQIMQENNRIAFTVQDNGHGFDPSAAHQGMGLRNIQTRVASYNGIMNIDSKIDVGTEINVELRITN